MSARKVLLIEPPYRNKYPPMGLMKLATYFRERGDDVRFFKGNLKEYAANLLCDEFILEINDPILLKSRTKLYDYIKTGRYSNLEAINGFRSSEREAVLLTYRRRFTTEDFPKFDIICVTTLFTFYWKKTVATINYAKKFLKKRGRIIVGGIASSLLPDKLFEDTGIRPIVGLLNRPGAIDSKDTRIIDELPLDYSILEEIDYEYPVNDAYFAYMTRGCPNNCAFCAVPRLEPHYCNYIGIKEQLDKIEKRYGARRNLLLMDNNVFASDCYDNIIEEIKNCGFQKGATYNPPNEYVIAIENIRAPLKERRNIRAYTNKIIKLYDEIGGRLEGEEQGNFYLERERLQLLYPLMATRNNILAFDATVRPLVERFFKQSSRMRIIDFNQGVDARLVTDAKMKKLAEINIRPLRIAFDHYEMKDIYIEAIKTAAKYGIKDLSNYLLYNFKDKPEDLYKRMKINVDLCEELGVTIYSFPMKYHPITDPKWFSNRDYIGQPHWNRKFIRAVQAVLNATKGKIGKGKSFFEEAFGCDEEEFNKILWMPEAFIIYRRKYDAELRERLAAKYGEHIEGESNMTNEWWQKFCALNNEQLIQAKEIIAMNKFTDDDINVDDELVKEVLKYYQIKREETQTGEENG